MIADEDTARAWLSTIDGYDATARRKLDKFIRLLAIENGRQNLIAGSTIAHVWRRHIADSAQLLAHVPRETSTWLDLGSGAGFPGIVVAILKPGVAMRLVESRQLRAGWLSSLAAELELTNVEVRLSRVQALASWPAAVISARAFAPLARLVDLAARFSTSDTVWVLPKGRSARDELDTLLGWWHTFHVEQSLTDADAGIIVGRLAGRKDKRE